MEEELTDDQSHYEISMTAGQAFVAFVLMLLSLAASFAFGLMIGKGQSDDRPVARKEAPAVAARKSEPVTVAADDFKPPAPAPAPAVSIEQNTAPPARAVVAPPPAPAAAAAAAPAPATPTFAQLISTSDQKTAEALAAKLIDGGFTAAYVERTTTDKGTIFRVRVKFPSETEARSAEPKLKTFAKEVWITR